MCKCFHLVKLIFHRKVKFFFPQYTDAIELLIHSYPKYVTVGSFSCDSVEEKVCGFQNILQKNVLIFFSSEFLMTFHFKMKNVSLVVLFYFCLGGIG